MRPAPRPPVKLFSLGLRPRQQRRLALGILLLLRFDFRYQDGRRHRRDWDLARLRSAIAVENLRRVGSGQDLLKTGEWCAYDVYATDQLIRPAIRVYAVDHQRHDREGL